MAAAPIEMMRSIVHDAQVAAKSFDSIAADDVEELLRASQEAVNVLQEVQRLAVTAALQLDVWSAHGFRSPGRWLAAITGLSPGSARSVVERAEAMVELPLVRSAALAGSFNDGQVRELVKVAERAGPFSDVDIDVELSVAIEDGPVGFGVALRRTHRLLDGERAVGVDDVSCASGEDSGGGCGEAETSAGSDAGAGHPIVSSTPAERERCTLWQRADGWWDGRVVLSPLNGELVAAALDRQIDRYLRSQREGDPSLQELDVAHLRAQALVDELALRREPSGFSTPDRYQVALNVHVGSDGTLQPDGPFPAEAMCDSTLFRMVLGAEGEVLDVGRASRGWTAPLSRAIRLRDRACRYPDCGLPGRFCDIHHCQHWEHGGPTSITNGVLLCRWHHSFVHAQRWRIDLDQQTQQPTFHRADGTIHTTAAMRARRE